MDRLRKSTLSMDIQRGRFEDAIRGGSVSLDRYVTEISTFKDSPIVRAYISCIGGAVDQVLGEAASVALAQDTSNHAGLLGSADIELVVKAPQGSISRERRNHLGLVVARAIFVDLRYKYTTIVGKQVVSLQPLTAELPTVDVAFQSDTHDNGCSSHAAAKMHAARTAVKALTIMQHIYNLPKVPGQDLEQIVIGANWQDEGIPSFEAYFQRSLDSIVAHSVSKAWREASLSVCRLLQPESSKSAS